MKTLKIRADTLYVSLFILGTTLAQAAPRRFDPESPSRIWDGVFRFFAQVRRAFDIIQLPIG